MSKFIIFSFIFYSLQLQAKEIRIAIWPGSEKFVPIIEMVYAKMQVPFEFVNLPTERSLTNVNNGNMDADIARSEAVLKMYPNLISSEISLANFSLVGYAKNEVARKISKPNELTKDYVVGLIIGTKIAEALVEKNKLKALKVNSTTQLKQLLAANRIQVALIATIQDFSILENSGFERLGFSFLDTHMVHIFNKKHSKLKEKFDTTLKELKDKNADFQKLLKDITHR